MYSKPRVLGYGTLYVPQASGAWVWATVCTPSLGCSGTDHCMYPKPRVLGYGPLYVPQASGARVRTTVHQALGADHYVHQASGTDNSMYPKLCSIGGLVNWVKCLKDALE